MANKVNKLGYDYPALGAGEGSIQDPETRRAVFANRKDLEDTNRNLITKINEMIETINDLVDEVDALSP